MTATPGQQRNARFAAAESTRLPMRMRQTGYKYLQAVGGEGEKGCYFASGREGSGVARLTVLGAAVYTGC